MRETATRAGLAEVSDVTLLNRLRQSEGWLRQRCLSLLAERQPHLDRGLAGRRLRVADGTLVKEPGKTGARFDWLRAESEIEHSGQCGPWPVWILDAATQQRIAGRLCAIRTSEDIRFRALAEAEASAEQVLACCRLRGQIELVFKPLKSLIALGHIPKHDPRSSHAWLYGKLLVALLSQKLAHLARTFSPWGCRLR